MEFGYRNRIGIKIRNKITSFVRLKYGCIAGQQFQAWIHFKKLAEMLCISVTQQTPGSFLYFRNTASPRTDQLARCIFSFCAKTWSIIMGLALLGSRIGNGIEAICEVFEGVLCWHIDLRDGKASANRSHLLPLRRKSKRG